MKPIAEYRKNNFAKKLQSCFTILLEILLCEKASAIKLRFSRLHLFAYQASLVQNFASQWTFFLYLFEIIVTGMSSKLITKLKIHLSIS